MRCTLAVVDALNHLWANTFSRSMVISPAPVNGALMLSSMSSPGSTSFFLSCICSSAFLSMARSRLAVPATVYSTRATSSSFSLRRSSAKSPGRAVDSDAFTPAAGMLAAF